MTQLDFKSQVFMSQEPAVLQKYLTEFTDFVNDWIADWGTDDSCGCAEAFKDWVKDEEAA